MAKELDYKKAGGCYGAILLLAAMVMVFIIVNPFSSGFSYPKAKEAETKANLHNIQLSVERFAVDHEGVYPNYLIGGSSADASGIPGTVAYTSDVLLREGYITKYPTNPFMRTKNPRSLEMQADLPTSITGNDPLRPGDPEGDLLGYRFGNEGNVMGQVLCDPRYEKWSFTDPLTGETEQRDTWAIIEHPFWDMWEGNRPEPYLPGGFFYKSMGPMIAATMSDDAGDSQDQQGIYNEHRSLDGDLIGPMYIPGEIDQYIMGAYGSIRTKGKDVLGDEQIFESNPLPSWTRSAYSITDLGGSPFRWQDTPAAGEANNQFQYGNPNGIRDGLILILTAGEDYIGDR